MNASVILWYVFVYAHTHTYIHICVMQIKVRTVSWRPVIPLITSFRPQLVKTALRLVAVVENCNYNHTLSLWLALCLAWQPQSLRSRLALVRWCVPSHGWAKPSLQGQAIYESWTLWSPLPLNTLYIDYWVWLCKSTHCIKKCSVLWIILKSKWHS